MQVEKTHGRVGQKIDAKAFRAACRDYAYKQVDAQRKDFKRLGVLGRLGAPVSHHGSALRGRAAARLRGDHQERPRVQGLQAGALVPELPLRAGRGRGRVRGHHLAEHLRALRGARPHAISRARFGTASPSRQRCSTRCPTSVAIWTTTPWTLPANRRSRSIRSSTTALVEFDLGDGRERLLVATERVKPLDAHARRARLDGASPRPRARRSSICSCSIRSTIAQVPVILGDHVTLDAGTGAVHTAPGHGLDDYIVGRRYDLEIENPVGGDGRFLPSTPLFAGEQVFDANAHVIEVLRERGRLLKGEPYHHAYPHCWRHKTPVIFRATPQWFISMDQAGLRKGCARGDRARRLDARLGRAAHQRHDRRPSRLVRVAAAHLGRADPAVRRQGDRRAASADARADRGGREAASSAAASMPGSTWMRPTLLGADAAAIRQGHRRHGRVVRFGRGASLRRADCGPRSSAPSDLYLEGSDQHRGWFHSSLLTSVAMHGRAPYRGVLTHGFTVDEKGRKMSKSIGNTLVPQKLTSTLGADVVRLWIAATDYANEMSVSDEILKRMADSYRRMRNTLRFLLGNMHGFDPARRMPFPGTSSWRSISGRSARRSRCRTMSSRRTATTSSTTSTRRCTTSAWSSSAASISTSSRTGSTPPAPNSLPRRSAQTAMYHVADAMVRWLAPILSFTAEEVWSFMPGVRNESVFLNTWHQFPPGAERGSEIDWPAFIALKADVARELERLRTAGQIGAPLEAEVAIYRARRSRRSASPRCGDELRFLLITSQARVIETDTPRRRRPCRARRRTSGSRSNRAPSPNACAAGICAAMWAAIRAHPELCARCVVNIEGPGEERKFA